MNGYDESFTHFFFVNNSNIAHKVDPLETLIIAAKLIYKK